MATPSAIVTYHCVRAIIAATAMVVTNSAMVRQAMPVRKPLKPIFLLPPIQGSPCQAERVRRATDITLVLLERPGNRVSFNCVQARGFGRGLDRCVPARRYERKVRRLQHGPFAEYDRPLDRMAKRSHVARPRMRCQLLQCPRTQPLG